MSLPTWIPVAPKQILMPCLLLFGLALVLPFNGTIALRYVLFAMVLMAALHALIKAQGLPEMPRLVFVWFALAPLSWMWSIDPEYTRRELFADVIYPFLGFMAAAILCRRDGVIPRYLFAGFIAGICLVGLIGLDQAARLPEGSTFDWYVLAHGLGQFSTLLTLAYCILLVWLVNAVITGMQWPAVLARTSLLLLVVLTATQVANRMFWLVALSVTVYVLANQYSVGQKSKVALRHLGILSLLLLSALPVFFWMEAQLHPANALQQMPGESPGFFETFTRNERFEMWVFWIEGAKERFWLGHGFGYEIPLRAFSERIPEHWIAPMRAHAHNALIDIYFKQGIVGLAVYLSLVGSLFHFFWRRRAEPMALLGSSLLIAMVLKNMSDDFMTRTPLLTFWLLLGGILGALQSKNKHPRDAAGKR